MQNRIIELLALGPDLRAEAQRITGGVNESYLLVHEVFTKALRDLDKAPREELRAHMTAQLRDHAIKRVANARA